MNIFVELTTMSAKDGLILVTYLSSACAFANSCKLKNTKYNAALTTCASTAIEQFLLTKSMHLAIALHIPSHQSSSITRYIH